MKKIIFGVIVFSLFVMGISVYAVDNTKPEDHTTNWMVMHGKKANSYSAECYSCHVERFECITCHQDTKPRNHTQSWTNKTHGMESRWSRQTCTTCHTEDFCQACHEETMPANHTSTLRDSHCNVGCQLPVGRWKNTISKDCIVCHDRIPIPTHAKPR